MSTPATAPLDTTPIRVIELLESELGLTRRDLASALQVDLRTIERWRAGRTYPQHDARCRLTILADLHRHLRETFANVETIRHWMHSPHRYLRGLTPAEAVRAGRADRVEAALGALDWGIFI